MIPLCDSTSFIGFDDRGLMPNQNIAVRNNLFRSTFDNVGKQARLAAGLRYKDTALGNSLDTSFNQTSCSWVSLGVSSVRLSCQLRLLSRAHCSHSISNSPVCVQICYKYFYMVKPTHALVKYNPPSDLIAQTARTKSLFSFLAYPRPLY